MDIVDLWELLSYVDDWSFETFPWDVFSLCRTTVHAEPTIHPALQSKNDEACNLPPNSIINNSEVFDSVIDHVVSPDDVPSEQVSQVEHSKEKTIGEEPDSVPLGDAVTVTSLPSKAVVEDGCEQEVYISDSPNADGTPSRTLEESMLSLQLFMEDKSALSAFEKLSKKKANAPMDVAKLPENVPRNRYKDVLPYDDSRVELKECKTGDYINASFVKMEIPQLQLSHVYIATQGPLPNTCDEFWQMVWEQQCSIIVMVTTLKERNRVKCHKYWPDLYEVVPYGNIQVTCFHETTTQGGITRDLLVINEEKNEDRHVIQMQYVAWPDHAVPDDATDFLNFVQQLREWRKVIGGHIVVHCSAGVGRTGVFILMETAMCLIESGEPVYPLELVKAMRDQRVMMVQTVGQYKFICEAVLKLYEDHKNGTEDTTERR